METFQYSLPAIFALGIMLLIYLLKSERIPINIPAAWQPLVATATGLGLLIATRIAQGFTIGRAIFDGLLAGLGAVGMSEVVKQAKGPPSDPPPPPKAPGSSLPKDDPLKTSGGTLRVFVDWPVARAGAAMLFALLAFGCTAAGFLNGLIDASNFAAERQTQAAPLLDKFCTQPLIALAKEPKGPARSKEYDKITGRCDGPELSYRQVRLLHARVTELREAAASDGGVTVGEIKDITKQLLDMAADLDAQLEPLRALEGASK